MICQSRYNVEDTIVKTDYFQECIEDLLTILQPSFYCIDLIVKVLLHGPDGSGKRMLAKAAANKLSMSFCEHRFADLFDENIVGTEKKVRTTLTKSAQSSPCLIYLTNYELLCRLEDADLDYIEHCIRTTLETIVATKSQPIVFVCATNNFPMVYHTQLADIFQHNISIKSPSLTQAEDIVSKIELEAEILSEPKKLLSSISDGEYYIGRLLNLIAIAETDAYQKSKLDAEKGTELAAEGETDTLEEDGIRWIDIGGLNQVKREIIDAIQLSLDFPQLKKSGLRRTGVLLYGPPGTGKTLLAKAVATECSLNFINVKGPELLNEYVGQSEDNIRKLFHQARSSSPSVIFFDELDSLAPNRGQAGDSGGVMDRMVSQILAEMDGIGKSDSVFVIGATNRVDLVDPALLRPGRFDRVLEVPLPATKESRLQILRALTRRIKLADDVDLVKIESLAAPNMSGADFQGLCARTLHRTFDRCIREVESGQSSEDDVKIITRMDDFLLSLEEN